MNLRALDCLRGLLAVYVVIGHARFLLWEGWASWKLREHPWWADIFAAGSGLFRFGHEAVMVFFVLSGFFIHLRAATPLVNEDVRWKFDIRAYAARRVHRIIPTYFFALLITVLFDFAGRTLAPALYDCSTGIVDLDTQFEVKGYSANSITCALLLLPSGMGEDFGTNGPLWSLGCEMVYYAAYPFWLLVRRITGSVAFVLVFAVGTYAAVFVGGGPVRTLLQNYPCWIAGAALAEWVVSKDFNISSYRVIAGAMGGVSLGILFMHPPKGALPILNSCLGLFATLFFAATPESALKKNWFLFLELLGKRSYTLYACHFPILTSITAITIQFLGDRPQSGWLALGGSVAAIIICLGLFSLCESHFLHARIRMNPSHPVS